MEADVDVGDSARGDERPDRVAGYEEGLVVLVHEVALVAAHRQRIHRRRHRAVRDNIGGSDGRSAG